MYEFKLLNFHGMNWVLKVEAYLTEGWMTNVVTVIWWIKVLFIYNSEKNKIKKLVANIISEVLDFSSLLISVLKLILEKKWHWFLLKVNWIEFLYHNKVYQIDKGLNYLKLGSTLSNIKFCNTTQLDNATKCHHTFKNFCGEPWLLMICIVFMPPYQKIGGHIVLLLSVCLSVHLSVCLHKLNAKT